MKKSIVIPKTQQAFSSYLKSQKQKEVETRTGEYTYQVWLNRITQTLNWRQEHWNGDKNWKRAYNLYRGKHWKDQDITDPSSDEVRDRITVNETGSSILNLVPFLMSSNAQFVCTPEKPTAIASSILQQHVLNYEWRRREIQPQMKKVVYDAVTIGHGIAKTGFVLELDEAIKKADGDIVYEDYIKLEAPYAKRISPYNFLVDPNASEYNLETARWCAELFYKNIDDALANSSYLKSTIDKIKNKEYSILKKESIQIDDNSEQGYAMDSSSEKKPDSNMGVFVEIWDKKHRKYYVFALGVPYPLIEKDWPYPYLKGFPYEMLTFIPINDEIYGVGIPYFIEDQQLELNRVRTSLFQHRRRFNRKYAAVENAVDESELEKLIEGADGTVIITRVPGAIEPIPDAAVSSDLQLVEAIIKEDIRRLTGADALLQGGALPSRTTAGEVNARGSIFRMKLDDRVEQVDRFLLHVGTQILQHIQSNYQTPHVVKITGEQGEQWVSYTPEDIQEQVEVSMESVSAPKIDPILDRQQALQVLQMAMQSLQLIQAGVLQLDMNELFKWVFEKLGIKDASRFFAASATPVVSEQTSSNLNNVVPFPQQESVPSPETVTDLQRQGGMAEIMNQSGLQL